MMQGKLHFYLIQNELVISVFVNKDAWAIQKDTEILIADKDLNKKIKVYSSSVKPSRQTIISYDIYKCNKYLVFINFFKKNSQLKITYIYQMPSKWKLNRSFMMRKYHVEFQSGKFYALPINANR